MDDDAFIQTRKIDATQSGYFNDSDELCNVSGFIEISVETESVFRIIKIFKSINSYAHRCKLNGYTRLDGKTILYFVQGRKSSILDFYSKLRTEVAIKFIKQIGSSSEVNKGLCSWESKIVFCGSGNRYSIEVLRCFGIQLINYQVAALLLDDSFKLALDYVYIKAMKVLSMLIKDLTRINVSRELTLRNKYGVHYLFQPIVSFPGGNSFGYEALVRGDLNQSAYEVISRYKGVDFIEFDLDSKYLALVEFARSKLKGDITLNFSTKTIIQHTGLRRNLMKMLVELGISSRSVIIEITESDLIDKPKVFSKVVEDLRRKGIRFAVDDFGAGFSGLSLLTYFKPDLIKIDSSLVQNISKHASKQSIVKAILRIATDFKIVVVAEGVESSEDIHWLLMEDILLFQGYFFGMPSRNPVQTMSNVFVV
jgi:blue light- and temperature-responsive anti-repressor